MSKSKVAIIILITIVIAGAIIAGQLLQKRTVDITATSTTFSLLSGDKTIATIDGEQSIKLSDGEYCAVAIDDKYSRDKKCFTIYKKDTAISVDFDFSKEYLESKLKEELPAIKEVVIAKYPSANTVYTICQGSLIGDGSWYGGILREKVSSPAEQGNYYYYIMNKKDGWNMLTTPNVVISALTPETKDIPRKIITEVNHLEPCVSEFAAIEFVTPPYKTDPFLPARPKYTY